VLRSGATLNDVRAWSGKWAKTRSEYLQCQRRSWHDLPMLVTLLPGSERTHVLRTLDDLHVAVENVRGLSSGQYPQQAIVAYFRWAHDAARALRKQVSAADIDRLVLTRRYDQLLSVDARLAEPQIVNGLLATELDERIEAFGEARTVLRSQIDRWSGPEVFVIADTSFYAENATELDEFDFARLLDIRQAPIHLLLLIVIVDELDGLKHDRLRDKARVALAKFADYLRNGVGPARLREEDYSEAFTLGSLPRGEITIELILDPPRHVRLPINDDEIIDRAVAIQTLAARPVTLMTYDTGQAMRAKVAGLQVKKLTYLKK
jgi:hypothetical protein